MKNSLELLYNPFKRIAGWQAFFVGIVIVTISVGIAYSCGTAFYGVFNVSPLTTSNFISAILGQAFSLLILYAFFYLAGIIFSKGVRLQDVIGTITLARFPYIILALSGYMLSADAQMNIVKNISEAALKGEMINVGGDMAIMIAIGFLALAVLIWYIALLWNAFRVSTDIKGNKAVLIFIGILLIADVLSRTLAWLLL